jgi:hypothetical protein
MQRDALHIARVAASVDVSLLPWHVPGLTLVAEGIDGASRSGSDLGDDANLAAVLGPAVSDQFWAVIDDVAAAAGWRVTVDAFASSSNARLDRFWARFPEPDAEAVDVLSVLDWSQSRCPLCSCSHREVLYAFPPPSLVRAVVAKACADRALCVLVVQVAILASYWYKLLAASVLPPHPPFEDGFRRIHDPEPLLRAAHGFTTLELAVFACDFSLLDPRPGLPPLAPGCPGTFARRRRPLCGSAEDLQDRIQLREALLARGAPLWSSPQGVPPV